MWRFVLCFCLLLPTPLIGQFQLIGVRLELGQDRQTVLRALQRAGQIKYMDGSDDHWLVGSASSFGGPGTGTVRFQDDQLVYMSRSWKQSAETPGNIMASTIRALTAVTGPAGEICMVMPEEIETGPETEYFLSVKVDCGERRVSLSVFNYLGSETVAINESWGNLSPP